jgi:hypothetical protein
MEISKAQVPITYTGITGPTSPTGSPIELPDYFIDGAKVQSSLVGVAVVLLRSRPQLADEQPTHEAVAILRMSPQMASQLATVIGSGLQGLQGLQAQVDEAQKAAGAAAEKVAE